MLTGPAGTGKTTLRKLLTHALPTLEDGVVIEAPGCPDSTTDLVPFLAFNMPSQPTVINVARAILKVLGDPKWNTGDREKLKERVIKAILQSRTKAVFGDEAQRLVDRNGEVARDDLADFIKELHGETGVIFILVGLGRLERLVTKDWQIGRRWDAPIRLMPYQPYDYNTYARTSDHEAYGGWLATLHDKLPIALAPNLDVYSEDEAAAELALLRFLHSSQGFPGNDKKLLKQALRIAFEDHSEPSEIGCELLARAFDRAFGRSAGRSNPFECEWKGWLPSGTPNLPPIHEDDRIMLNAPRRRPTKRQRRIEVTERLTLAR
jgi:hypothetical protein